MSSNRILAELDASSSTSDMSATASQRGMSRQEAVESSSSEDANVDTEDSSASSDSSDDSDLAPPSTPVLVSLESPLLAPIIIALNATERCASVFANNGVDILDSIGYDPDWWRRPSSPVLPSTNSEEGWMKLVAVELQRLNAFLDGKMERKLAATAGMEELLRMKVPRLRERYLHINDIFACLGLIPTVQDVLLNSAIVEGESIQLLPVGVNPELDGSTLQQALDDMFWSQVLDDSESDNPEDVPVLDRLSDVVVVSCQSWNTQIDEQLWPERYTKDSLPEIQAKRKRRQELKQELRELQSRLAKIATVNGANVPTSLEISSRAMRSAGNEEAADELGAALDMLRAEISSRNAQTQQLDQELLEESKVSLELDRSQMTPYSLKGVVLFENEEDTATTVTQSRSSPGSWIWQSQNRSFSVRLDQVLGAAREADNFLAVYEKQTRDADDEDGLKPAPMAPSIEQFCKADNAAMNIVPIQPEEEPRESSYEPMDAGNASGNPWITE